MKPRFDVPAQRPSPGLEARTLRAIAKTHRREGREAYAKRLEAEAIRLESLEVDDGQGRSDS